MKRSLSLLLVLILMMTFLPVLAEEEIGDVTDYFDSYASRVGNIYFTMYNAPDMILHDEDMDRKSMGDELKGICIGWKDKQQLIYSDDECEWQYHIADISGTIAEAREAFSGQDEMYIRGNALLHFAVLTLSITGVQIDALDPKLTKKTFDDVTLPMVTVSFEYEDLPGVPYRCVGLLDGDMAVLLIGNVCADFDAMADAMGVITPEQEAVIAERCVPCENELGLLTFTMPAQTGSYFKPGSRTIACFTEAYHMITVEYMPLSLNELLGIEKVTDDDLLSFVTALGENPMTEGSFEAELMRPGVARAKMIMKDAYMEYAEPDEVWFILMPFGCYTVTMPLTADADVLRSTLAIREDADVYERDTVNEILYAIFGGEPELDIEFDEGL